MKRIGVRLTPKKVIDTRNKRVVRKAILAFILSMIAVVPVGVPSIYVVIVKLVSAGVAGALAYSILEEYKSMVESGDSEKEAKEQSPHRQP